MDLSAYSNEELQAIVNGSSSPDLSNYSIEELKQIAGISENRMITPTLGQAAEYAAKAGAGGAAGMLDLVTTAAALPSKLGRAALTGSISDIAANPSSLFENFFSRKTKEYIGSPEDSGIVANPEHSWFKPEYVKAAMEGAVVPGGQLLNAISGVSGEVAHQMFPDSKIAPLVGAMTPTAGLKGASSVLGKVEDAANSAFMRASGITSRDVKAAQLSNSYQSVLQAREKLKEGMEALKGAKGAAKLGYGDAFKSTEDFLETAAKKADDLIKPIAQKLDDTIKPVSEKLGPRVELDWDVVNKSFAKVPDELKGEWRKNFIDLYEKGFSSPKTLADIQANKMRWNANFRANPNQSSAAALDAEEVYRKALQSTIEKNVPEAAGLNQQMAPLLELKKGFAKDLPTAMTESDLTAFRRGLSSTGAGGFGAEKIGGIPGLIANAVTATGRGVRPLALLTEDVAQILQKPLNLITKANRGAPSLKKSAIVGAQATSNSINRAYDKALETMGEEPLEKPETPIVISGKRVPKQFLVEAVIKQESAGNPKAVSPVGALGLMQIMPDTAKEIAKELGIEKYDLKDPETNVKFGTYYLTKKLKEFKGDLNLALAAYNAGSGNVRKWIRKYGATWDAISKGLKADRKFSETVKYVPGVLAKIKTEVTEA